MATRLDSPFVMLTISRLCLLLVLFGYYDSSLLPDFGTPMLSTRLIPVPVLLTPNLLSDFLPVPDWTLFVFLTRMVFTPVCTCIVHTRIYTGLEMGRSPSSIYFATTLAF